MGWHIATKSDFENLLAMVNQNAELIDICEGGELDWIHSVLVPKWSGR